MSAKPAIGFLGLGIMGAPMARNLARAGFAVRAWNRSPDKAAAVAEAGVAIAADPQDCARGAEILMLMLSTGAVCDDALFGAAGAAPALAAGATVVVMSSIPVETAQAQAARLAGQGVDYVDAPVSGGERGAIEASLSIMAGGSDDAIARARPALDALGRLTHVGPVGAGQLTKLANQLIVGVTIGAVAEAMLLIEAGGGDPRAAHLALQGGFADSTIWRQHGARILEQRFGPGAFAHVQLKDLATVAAFAAARGLDLPFATLARTEFAAMCASGRADLDHSALFLHLRDRARSA